VGWTSVSTSQIAMIAYSRVIWREQFSTHVIVCGAVKFFPNVSREIYGYIIGQNIIYAMC